MTTLEFYAELRQRKLVRLGESFDDCPPLARKVVDHPDFAAIRIQLRAGFLGKAHRSRWLNNLNFTHPASHQLSWVHLNAYLEWEQRSYGRNPPQASNEPVLVAMGGGESSGSHTRQTRPIGSREAFATHGVQIGQKVYTLQRLDRVSAAAPEPLQGHVRALLCGDAPRMPLEPTEAILEAVEWVRARL